MSPIICPVLVSVLWMVCAMTVSATPVGTYTIDASAVSPSRMVHVQNSSDEVATFEEQAMASAAAALSNTSLADLQNDTDTQRLQHRFRERKREERLLLIQSQILRTLGISRHPNNSSLRVIPEDERRKIIDILEKVQSSPGQGNSLPVQLHAERVQSFYPTCGAIPVNTEQVLWEDDNAFRLYYDIDFPKPSATTEISIASAKLRLYKTKDPNATPCGLECDTASNSVSPQSNFMENLYRCASRGINVSVWQYTRPLRSYKKEKKRLVDSRTISIDTHGWVDFNIVSAVNHWFQHRGKNFGLEIEVEDAFGAKKATADYFQKMNCSEGAVVQDPPFPNIVEMHPDMGENESAIFDNETYPTLDLQTIELSREEPPPTQTSGNEGEHVVHKRQTDDAADVYYATPADDRSHHRELLENGTIHRRICTPPKFRVSFTELGLDYAVVAPESFTTASCQECAPSDQFSEGIYIGTQRLVLNCFPYKYNPVRILYVNHNETVVLTNIRKLSIRSCLCSYYFAS